MYKLSQKAAEDFGNIYEYTFLNFGEDQADKYTDELESVLKTISEAPFNGRVCDDMKAGIRRHEHHKHSIFYRIRKVDIFIVRILHQQMNPMLYL